MIDLYAVYSLIKRLTLPFNRWPAYKSGIIDDDGNVLRARNTLSFQERKNWTYFDILVLNLKRILHKLPYGRTLLASYVAALWLLKEPKVKRTYTESQLREEYMKYFKEYRHEQQILTEAASGPVTFADVVAFAHEMESILHTARMREVEDRAKNNKPDWAKDLSFEETKKQLFALLAPHDELKAVDKQKWVYINFATGHGKYMVNKETGLIYGIKGYAQPDKRFDYGHLKSTKPVDMVKRMALMRSKYIPEAISQEALLAASKRYNADCCVDEDAPVNAAGTGGVAGIGVGPDGEPGGQSKLKMKAKKKTEDDGITPIANSDVVTESKITRESFAGQEVFVVDNDKYHACRMGKKAAHRYERYVGSDGVGEAIRQYGRTTPGAPIIVRNADTGAMMYLRYGKRHAGLNHNATKNEVTS